MARKAKASRGKAAKPYKKRKASSSGERSGSKAKRSPAKRKPTAFINFSVANRKKVIKENPNATFGGVAKILGGKWRSMSTSEKNKWK